MQRGDDWLSAYAEGAGQSRLATSPEGGALSPLLSPSNTGLCAVLVDAI